MYKDLTIDLLDYYIARVSRFRELMSDLDAAP